MGSGDARQAIDYVRTPYRLQATDGAGDGAYLRHELGVLSKLERLCAVFERDIRVRVNLHQQAIRARCHRRQRNAGNQ